MADDGRLGFAVELDKDNAEENIKILEKRISELCSKFIDAGEDIDKVTQSIKLSFLELINEGYGDEVKKNLSEIKGYYDGIDSEIASSVGQIQSLYDSVETADAGEKIRLVTEALIDCGDVTDEVRDKFNKLISGIAKSNDADKAAEKIEEIKESVKEESDASDKASAISRSLQNAIKGVGNAAGKSAGSIKSMSGAARVLRGVLSGGLVGALGAIVTILGQLLIAKVTECISGLIQSIKDAHDEAKKLLKSIETEDSKLDFLENEAEKQTRDIDNKIKEKEHELALAKARGASLSEQYKIEKELNALYSERANKRYGFFDEGAEIEENKKKLYEYKKALGDLKELQRKGESKVELKINGKLTKVDIEKAIEDAEAAVKLYGRKVQLGTQLIDDRNEAEERNAITNRSSQDAYRNARKTERAAERELANARISLIEDSYKREKENIKKNSENRIQDLRVRLNEEKNLTAKARAYINQQIIEEEKIKDKKLQELEVAHQQKLQSIRREIEDAKKGSAPLMEQEQRDELTQQYNRKIEDAWNRYNDKNTTEEEKELLLRLIEQYGNAYKKELAELNKKLFAESLSYENDVIELRLESVKKGSEEEYKLRLNSIESQRRLEIAQNKNLAEDRRKSEADINKKYDALRQQEIMDFLAENDASYRQWLDKTDGMTVVQLKKMLDESKKAINTLLKQKIAGNPFVDEKEIDKLLAKIAELEKIIREANLTPEQEKIEQWEKVASYVSDLGSSFSDLGDAIGGTTGEVISDLGEIITSVGTTITTVTEGIEKASKAGSSAIKAVETASVILTVISVAVKAIQKIVSWFKSNDEEKAKKEAEAWQRKIDDITKAYNRLGDAIDKAFGTEKTSLIQRQIKEQEKLLDEYQQKLDTLKERLYRFGAEKLGLTGTELDNWVKEQLALSEAGREYEQQIYDINQQLDDLRDRAIEAIYGTSVQSAVEEFAEAYAQAWADGTSAAKLSADTVKKLMKGMILENIKMMVMNSGVMKDIMNNMAAAFYAEVFGSDLRNPYGVGGMSMDGVIADSERRLNDLAERLNEVFGAYSGFFNDANDRTASARGIAQASQESVDELNGRMGAVQLHTFNLSQNSDIIRDFVANINGSVQRIEYNTEALHSIRSDMAAMRTSIDTIQRHGISLAQ